MSITNLTSSPNQQVWQVEKLIQPGISNSLLDATIGHGPNTFWNPATTQPTIDITQFQDEEDLQYSSSSTGFVYRVRGFITGDHGAGTDDANNYGIVKDKSTRLDGTAYTSTSVPSNNDWEIIPSSHVVDITPKIFNGTTEIGDFVKYEYRTKWSVAEHSHTEAKNYGWLEYSNEGAYDVKVRPIVDPSEEFEFFPARYPLGVWNQRYNDVETDALWRHSRIGYCVRIASKTGAQSMEETVNMKMPSKQFTLNVPRPDEIKTPGVDGVTAWQSGTITDEDGARFRDFYARCKL